MISFQDGEWRRMQENSAWNPFNNKTIPNPNNTLGIVIVWFSSMIPVAIRRHPSFLVNFRLYLQIHTADGLLGSYISPTSGHFPVWWDMLIPYSVYIWSNYSDLTPQHVAAEGTFPYFSLSRIEWDLTNGPLSVSCDRAIRYSGYLRVRSVGPSVGDLLDSGKSRLVKYYKLARYP